MNRMKVVVGLWSLCQVAWAAPIDAWDFRARLSDPAWSWAVPEFFELPGARLRVQRFSARVVAQEAARTLTRLPGSSFSRLQLTGPAIWLSGLSGAVHWLARLQVGPEATEGEISSLEPYAHFSHGFDALSLMPAGSRPVIQVPAPHAGAMSLSRLEADGRADPVLAHVARQLRARHWQPVEDATPDRAFAAEWRSADGARLSILYEAGAGRVFLTFWHRAEASR